MKQDLTRRNFIGSLAAAGTVGIVSAKDLPDVPADLFPTRGKYERIMMSYARVEAGATKPFSVLHISDTHLTAAYDNEGPEKLELRKIRTQTFGGHQEEALRDSLEWAKGNADFVLHTGDLIDWQSEANYALVKKYFGPNVFGSLGNHEYSPDMWLSDPPQAATEAYRDRSRAKLAATYPFDISLASKVVNGVNFVTLDDVYGTVSEKQVARFKAEAKKGLPIVLAMHVPIYTDYVWQACSKFWFPYEEAGRKFTSAAIPPAAGDYKRQREDPLTRDFIAYLRREPLLKAVLTGHLHIAIEERFSPTAVQYVVGGNFLFHGREILFV